MIKRMNEIDARLEEIRTEIPKADEERIKALNLEVDALNKEQSELREKLDLAGKILKPINASDYDNAAEARAKAFAASGHMEIDNRELRSVLVSGGKIARPTDVSGINDLGTQVSSIVDMVKVVNCAGMGSNIVAYVSAGSAAGAQTEGSAAASSDPTFDYVTITPTSYAVMSQISKQVKKQSPLLYEQKVRESAYTALRKQASSALVTAIKGSLLTQTVDATVASAKGVIDAQTLRKIVLNYGTNEEVAGQAVLFLNKIDLIAFGDVRGTNEKKAVYEIIPDGANPNTGIIKDGGLSVRYCLNSNVTACAGTAQASKAETKTMFYGNPMNCELDLFSDYEINVSDDFAMDKLMTTIVGDCELGADVVAANGFVFLTIPAGA